MSGPAVNYICRSCRHALRVNRSIAHQKLTGRNFSSTPQNSKTLATFTPTSSPELDALLTTWRNEIFLPSILPPHHQALIYKKSRHEILTTPPGVTVTVQTALPPLAENASKAGEEDFKLLPMNAFKRPNKKKSLQQICEHLSSTDDAVVWDNIIPFLEGMQTARQTLPDAFLETLTRRANGVGQRGTIIRAAAMAKRTGVTLAKREITRLLLIDIHQQSVASSYRSAEPAKTLNRIVLLLEDKGHCGALSGKNIEKGLSDMRRDPVVVASVLEQASAQSLMQHQGKDEDGKVATAVQKLLALANFLPGGITGYLETVRCPTGTDSHTLEDLAMVSNALTLADKVDLSTGKSKHIQLTTELRQQLKQINARIDVLKEKVTKEANGKPRRSLQMLDAALKAQADLS